MQSLRRLTFPRRTLRLLLRIECALASGDKVTLVGFGTFEVKERAAREGRNPATGETIKIKASKAPAFKAGKELKEKVNSKKKCKK